MDALHLAHRVRLLLEPDHIGVWPDPAAQKRRTASGRAGTTPGHDDGSVPGSTHDHEENR
jgi:hypothetical protein